MAENRFRSKRHMPEGYRKILDVAVRHLETEGEASLRMTAIAKDAGVSLALITRHFGSRDGLVSAAQQARFAGAVSADLSRLDEMLADNVTSDELRVRIAELVHQVIAKSRESVRLGRIAALATTHGRPESRDVFSQTVGDLLDEMTRLLEYGQRQNLFRTDVHPRALAMFLQAYPLGLVVADLDPKGVSEEELHHVIFLAIETFLAA